jgi:RNA polymerase-binding transcription factor DksA
MTSMITKEFIEENKKKLLDEQQRIKTILNHEDTKDGAGEFPGEYKPKFDELGSEEGENASEVENFGNQLGVTQSLEAKLSKIDIALKKIADGTYGKCEMGDEIEEARLAVEPSAETCIKHSK